ncbi:MAG: glycerate kinase, partial [Nitriliruptorales bacterium]|nr:glycerate kinase [Nitriliruptorales bacterium]
LVGLGGSATVDGGAGAVTALGFRPLVADGSGLRVGGHDLAGVRRIMSGWEADWSGIRVDLLADVTTTLPEAAATFGPQKGANPEGIARLDAGLRAWADAVEEAFGRPGLRNEPGSGAAGGLAFGLSASIGGRILPGAATVADLVGLSAAINEADLVITGEGRLDATSSHGKVVGEVLQRARDAEVEVGAVCGQVLDRLSGLADVEAASPDGPGPDPVGDVAAAAERLAQRI